jgi:hypothetical protein
LQRTWYELGIVSYELGEDVEGELRLFFGRGKMGLRIG